MTLIQNTCRVVSKVVLRPPSFVIAITRSSCTDTVDWPTLLTNGSRINSLQVLLLMEINALTLLKTKIGVIVHQLGE